MSFLIAGPAGGGVAGLFKHLEGGAIVDEFLEWFPGVTREQDDAVLKYAQRSLAIGCKTGPRLDLVD